MVAVAGTCTLAIERSLCGPNCRSHSNRVEVAAIASLERAGGMQHRWGRVRDRCSNLHRCFMNCQIIIDLSRRLRRRSHCIACRSFGSFCGGIAVKCAGGATIFTLADINGSFLQLNRKSHRIIRCHRNDHRPQPKLQVRKRETKPDMHRRVLHQGREAVGT
jgi:hypothetical protein